MLYGPNAEGMFTAPSARVTETNEKRSVGKVVEHLRCLVTIQLTPVPACEHLPAVFDNKYHKMHHIFDYSLKYPLPNQKHL